jgi:hypothetical protein
LNLPKREQPANDNPTVTTRIWCECAGLYLAPDVCKQCKPAGPDPSGVAADAETAPSPVVSAPFHAVKAEGVHIIHEGFVE